MTPADIAPALDCMPSSDRSDVISGMSKTQRIQNVAAMSPEQVCVCIML